MSLNEMIWFYVSKRAPSGDKPGNASLPRLAASKGATYVLVTQVLEELQFSVGPLTEYRGRERLHDLFDRDGSSGKLVLGRAVKKGEYTSVMVRHPRDLSNRKEDLPDQSESTHTDRLEVDISSGDLKDGTEDRKLDKVGHVV